MADNFHFDMTGVALELALQVAFGGHRKATHWGTQPARERVPSVLCEECKTRHGGVDSRPMRLILFWVEPKGMFKDPYFQLPAPLGADTALTIVRSWLQEVPYGGQPDHDGDNEQGWRVYNESWGHVAGCYQAFVAIEPAWLMYGK